MPRVQTDPRDLIAIETLGLSFGALRLCLPEAVQRMKQSLERHGQLTPLLACPSGDGVELIDGFKRVRAAREIGLEHLGARVVRLESWQAKTTILLANAHRSLDEIEEAWLVRALYRDDQLEQPEIARILGRHKSWVCRRLALAERLDDGVEADLRLGLLTSSAARELARLPRGNQRAAADVVIQRGLTSHQTAKLATDLLDAAPEDRDKVLAAAAASCLVRAPPRARPKTPAEVIVGDVAAIGRIGARMQSRLHERPLASFGDNAAALVTDALGELLPVLGALVKTIERVTNKEDLRCNVGPTDKS